MNDLEKILDKPKDYDRIDGTGELVIGLFWLSFTIYFRLASHGSEDSLWYRAPAIVAFVTISKLLAELVRKAIKKYVTYPRTGYVEYRNLSKTSKDRKKLAKNIAIIYGIRVVIVVLLFSYLFFALKHRHSISAPISLFALLLAAPYLRFARETSWKWLIFLAMLAATLAIALLPANQLAALAPFNYKVPVIVVQFVGAFYLAFASTGGLFLLSGLITFGLYLRHTQPPVLESQ
jgi:hypothetical protein